MTCFPDNRKEQTHREHDTSVLLVAPEVSGVGERELVKVPKTNSRFPQFLHWAHPHTDGVLILTAKEWE